MSQLYIVATDGTSTSAASEDYVSNILPSSDNNVELELVTVVESLDPEELEAVKEDINLSNESSRRKNEAEEMLNKKCDRYEEAGFEKVSIEVLTGEPGEAICRYAEQKDADGIFMGRGRQSRLGEAFYGSVSHYVLLNASTSVIITPENDANESEDEDSDIDYRASRMEKN